MTRKKPGAIMIGADPEFAFLNKRKRIVEAYEIINPRHNFGLDGCESIAEMRPNPSANPSQVVHNLYKDFLRGYDSNPQSRDLYWKAGSVARGNGIFALGGHIHFGMNAVLRKTHQASREEFYQSMITYLDTYLAQIIRLLENPAEGRARIRGGYGYLGDYRRNNHGIEYRVLGSWLTSPRVAEGVLCLAQTLAYQRLYESLNNLDARLDRLRPYTLRQEQNNRGGNDGFPVVEYRKKFPEIQNRIRHFQLYQRHELPIEFIFRLVEKQKTWYPGKNVDMKMAWGLVTDESVKTSGDKVLPSVKFEDIWKRSKERK